MNKKIEWWCVDILSCLIVLFHMYPYLGHYRMNKNSRFGRKTNGSKYTKEYNKGLNKRISFEVTPQVIFWALLCRIQKAIPQDIPLMDISGRSFPVLIGITDKRAVWWESLGRVDSSTLLTFDKSPQKIPGWTLLAQESQFGYYMEYWQRDVDQLSAEVEEQVNVKMDDWDSLLEDGTLWGDLE